MSIFSNINSTFSQRGAVERSVLNGVTTQYLYDGLNIVAEEDASGDVDVFYIMGLNIDEPLARVESDGDVHYYHADILGSIVALTVRSGSVTTQYNYSPFGVTQVIGTDVPQPFRFTGREYDAETGMYYYRARYYAPELKRFITEDPIRFESGDVNWYRYVGNDPVNVTDPLGLEGMGDMGDGLPNQANTQPAPGFNWCGPGNNGLPPSSQINLTVDTACQAHDNCYTQAGLSYMAVLFPFNLTPDERSAKGVCDRALCNVVRGSGVYIEGIAIELFCDDDPKSCLVP